MTTAISRPPTQHLTALRNIYVVRFVFAVAWALVLITSMPQIGPLLTILLVIYPLADAGAVFWQMRSEDRTAAPKLTENINVAVSVVVAIAVGVASTMSIAAALGVWGAWATLSGITQLVTAVQRRLEGGQIPLMISGGISVVAGISFLVKAFGGAESIGDTANYAILGGLFFLVAAIRLAVIVRRA